jgi:TM2 domain-containing membrane protein YozV
MWQEGINPAWPIKSRMAAAILAILLGGIGIQWFYLGQVGKGILSIIFCWTYIPTLIGVITGIIMLCGNDHNFSVKYQVRTQ